MGLFEEGLGHGEEKGACVLFIGFFPVIDGIPGL
jgi:hypothetical protein